MIKQSTTFVRIIRAVRKTFRVSDQQTVSLDWDGDALDPDKAIQDTEIEDMDVVDVHIG
jgi:hypothetical protein